MSLHNEYSLYFEEYINYFISIVKDKKLIEFVSTLDKSDDSIFELDKIMLRFRGGDLYILDYANFRRCRIYNLPLDPRIKE